MKQIISLTFDYELFFRRTGSVENCLLKPTNYILNAMNNEISATFFIDATYLLRLNSLSKKFKGLENEKISIENQIKDMVNKGHRVELHLHPHWLDARYEDYSWEFPHYDHYKLHSLKEDRITDLFVSGTQLLEELASDVKSGYKVVAFRAGGWCVLPFQNLKKGFNKSGIYIDSSIAPQIVLNSQTHKINFNFIKQDVDYWRFENDPIHDRDGKFIEIPISTFRYRFWSKIMKHLLVKVNNIKQYGDGTGLNLEKQDIFHMKKYLPKNKQSFLSLELTYKWIINDALFENRNKSLINFISHPKLMNAKSIKIIRWLQEQDEYKINNIFTIYNNLINK